MTQLQLPETVKVIAHSEKLDKTGHVWTVEFSSGHRTVFTSTHNPNETTTFHLLEVFGFWTTQQAELEAMLANYEVVGNWEQEK